MGIARDKSAVSFNARRVAVFIALAVLTIAVATVSFANDPPHVNYTGYDVDCVNCHNPGESLIKPGFDNSPMNVLCLTCHDGSQASVKATHSAIQTGDNTQQRFWSGLWTNDCVTCHNPHYQRQLRIYKGEGVILSSGTIIASTTTTVTLSGVSWTTDEWVGYWFVADTNFRTTPPLFKITANTNNMVTVDRDIPGRLRSNGRTAGIIYGKNIRDAIDPSYQSRVQPGRNYGVVNSSGVTMEAVSARPVRYFSNTGSFSGGATGEDLNAAQADSICVVCHTQTIHMNYGYAKFGDNFDDRPANYLHNYSDTQPCWNSSCHNPPKDGFGAGCTNCHGFAPANAASLINGKSPNGFTQRSTQFPLNGGAGKHTTHYDVKNYDCGYCHFGGTPSGDHNDEGSPKVHVGFNIFDTYQGGVYTAPAILNSTYALVNGGSTVYVEQAGTRTCSAIYCHSNADPYQGTPVYQTGDWDLNGSLTCTSCHQNQDTAANMDTMSSPHGKHVGSDEYGSRFECATCHNTVVSGFTTIIGNSLHADGTKTVAFDATYGGSFDTGAHSCTTVYCHSTGTRLGLGEAYQSQAWTGSVGCSSCHKFIDTTANMTSGNVMSAPHATHVATDSYGDTNRGAIAISCKNCHNATTTDDSTVNQANHVNKQNNILFEGAAWFGNPTWDSGAYACSTFYCHSDGANNAPVQYPQWSDVTTADCGDCHGATNTTPPTSTPHIKHVGDSSIYEFNCKKCHSDTVDASASDSTTTPGIANKVIHVNQVKDVVLNNADSLVGAIGDYSGGTCSTVYCHSMGKPTAVPIANLPDPTAEGNYGSPKSQYSAMTWASPSTDCNDCHGKTDPFGRPDYESGGGGTPDANSHGPTGTHANAACTNCHNVTVPLNNSPVAGTKHVDGTRDVDFAPAVGGASWDGGLKTCTLTCHIGGYSHTGSVWGNPADCTACHGQPAINAATLINGKAPEGATGREAQFASTEGAGGHDRHYNQLGLNDCDYCHTGGGSSGSHNSSPPNVTIGFGGVAYVSGGIYQAPEFGTAIYDVAAGGTTTVNFPVAGARVCSGIYCHSDGRDYAGTITYKNANWDETGIGCNYCHGDASGLWNVNNVHPTHINATTYNFNCRECHADTYDGSAIIGNPVVGNHVDNEKDVAFDGIATGGDAYSGTTPSCSSVYCHSPGTKSASPDVPRVDPQWNSSLPTDCSGCHSGDASAAATMSSNVHSSHVNNITKVGRLVDCSACHAATALDSRNILGFGNHVNKLVNVKFDNAVNADSDGPTYNLGDTTVADGVTKNPGTAVGGCTNVYCHSSGNTLGGATPIYNGIAWNDAAIDCDDCHGDGAGNAQPSYVNGGAGQPDANSHEKHVVDESYTCNYCHEDTIDSTSVIPAVMTVNTTSGLHINRAEDVTLKLTFGYTGDHDGSRTCSATYCHGPTNTSPQWGGTTICASCHDATNTAAGSHPTHYGSPSPPTSNNTANSSTTDTYIYNCGICHNPSNVTHVGGPALGERTAEVFFDLTLNPSGTYDDGTALSTDPAGFKWSDATCSSLWCHGNFDGNGNNAIPQWGVASTAQCGSCHDVDAATETANGFDGTMDGGQHDRHVNTIGKTCDYCHASTASGYSIANRVKHANGQVTVDLGDGIHPQIQAGSTYSGSNLYERTTGESGLPYGNCTNLYCHSTVQASPPDGLNGVVFKEAGWDGTPGAPCGSCHKADAPTVEQDTGSHLQHVDADTYGLPCSTCHLGAGGGTTKHANYEVNLDIDNTWGVDADYTGTMPPGDAYGSCSSVYCHSLGDNTVAIANLAGVGYATGLSNTQVWGPTDVECSGCHGRSRTDGMPDYTGGVAGANDANSHAAHVADNNIGCERCHVSTTTDGTSINYAGGLHVDGSNTDLFFDSLNSGGTYDSTPGTKTCNVSYCHGGVSPSWGDVGGATCGSCHAVNNTLEGRHATHYETATNASDRTAVSNPTSTEYIFNCGVCHDGVPHATGPVSGTITAQVIINGDIAGPGEQYFVGGGSFTDSTTGYKYTDATCSTYCHTDGNGGSPNDVFDWNDSPGALNCGSCHNQKAPEPLMATVNHPAHLSDGPVMTAKSCEVCHVRTTSDGASIANKILHVNRTKDVTINGTWDSNADPTDNFAGGNCNNVYCHSDGRGNYAVATWGGADADCVYCHGGSDGATGGAGTTLGVNHPLHVTTAYGIGCTDCHNEVADNNTTINATTGIANHVDTTKDIRIAAARGGDGNDYTGGTCSTTACHGTVVSTSSTNPVTWGTDLSGSDNCTICHGNLTTDTDGNAAQYKRAPGADNVGVDTAGQTGTITNGVSDDTQVGAHQAHLTTANNFTTDVLCSECHKVPSAVTDADHLDWDSATKADFLWAGRAILCGSSPDYFYNATDSAWECSNVYCHGANMPKNSGNGSNITPKWNDPNYITDAGPSIVGDGSGNCEKCHGGPPNTPGNEHNGVSALSECSGCHPDTVLNAAGTIIVGNHIDGTVQAAGDCNSCHEYPPISGDGKSSISGNGGKGAHRTVVDSHVDSGNLDPVNDVYFNGATGWAECQKCHDVAGAGDHRNGTVNVSIDSAYSFDGGTPNYLGSPGVAASSQEKTCTNVSCHFQKTPNWGCDGEE